MEREFNTRDIEPGQCLIKRHDYSNQDRSQFFALVEGNDPENYKESKKFISKYGSYLRHSTPRERLKLIDLPYPTADDKHDTNPEYREKFESTFKPNFLLIVDTCIDRYGDGLDRTAIKETMRRAVEAYQIFLASDKSETDIFKPLPENQIENKNTNLNMFYLLHNISDFFFEDNILIDNSSLRDYETKLDGIKYHTNSDFAVIEFLESMETGADGWIRSILADTHKMSQEIAVFPTSINKIVDNDGCNCDLLINTCRTPIEHSAGLDKTAVTPQPPNTLRIMSYNIHMWTDYGRPVGGTVVYGILKNILEVNPDIVCFQEDDGMFGAQDTSGKEYSDEYTDMFFQKDQTYREFSGCKYENKFFASVWVKKALLDKYDVRVLLDDVNTIQDDVDWFDQHCATILEFNHKTSENKFILANTHLSSEIDVGKINADKFIELLRPYAQDPLVVTGDFNSYSRIDYDTPDEIGRLCGMKKGNTWDPEEEQICDDMFYIDDVLADEHIKLEDTFQRRNRLHGEPKLKDTSIFGGRIDYILGNAVWYENYQDQGAHQLRDWASDHTPIYADFRIPDTSLEGGALHRYYRMYQKNRDSYLAIRK